MNDGTAARWSDSQLDHLRTVGDPLADAVLGELAGTPPGAAGAARAAGATCPGADLVAAVARRAEAGAGACRELLAQANAVPSWVSFPRMLAGYRIGFTYPVAGGMALLCGSLAESYASALGAKVLIRTGNLERSTRRRIYETADFLHTLASSNGPRPGTSAHRTLLNLRLLHARIRKMAAQGHDWEPRWGLPVNQEDYGSTLLVFSLVYARGLQRLGVPLSEAELDSIHHGWRYAGYVMGVDPQLLTESRAEEAALYAAITRRHHHPDADSRVLLAALFSAMAWQPPFFVPAPALHAICRRLLGDTLADALAVPRAPPLASRPHRHARPRPRPARRVQRRPRRRLAGRASRHHHRRKHPQIRPRPEPGGALRATSSVFTSEMCSLVGRLRGQAALTGGPRLVQAGAVF